MKVDVHPADDGGCGWYRLRWPAETLQAAGHQINIGAKLDCVRERNVVFGDRPIDVLVDADVIVFQRPLRHELVEIIPVLQRRGVAVVVEIDDDFHALPRAHPATRGFSPQHNPDRNWYWLKQAALAADLVTCTTPALAERYAPHGRVAVLPNCVPGWYLNIDGKPNERPTVGWTGTPVTHVGDLEECGQAIHEVQTVTGCGFRAIGSAKTLDILDVDGAVIDWCPLADRTDVGYAATVASLDVGLVPLVDSPFNRAKSALKMSEYAALGVAPVVSPTPDNLRLHELGIGVIAEQPADWAGQVTALVSDEQRRVELVERGREAMRALTYEARAELWWEAWELALTHRHGTRAA